MSEFWQVDKRLRHAASAFARARRHQVKERLELQETALRVGLEAMLTALSHVKVAT